LVFPRFSGHKECTEKSTLKQENQDGQEELPKLPRSLQTGSVRIVAEGRKSAGQIERELGITPGLLVKWRARYQAVRKGRQAVYLEPGDLEAAKAEIKRLRRELAEAEEERDILKKAVNIFSRKSR